MEGSRLPTEVELVYDVMPCNAMRTEMEPGQKPHPCTYFRKWGTYHSYDYTADGPPPKPGIVQETKYLGRARLLPELLSGCRKCPIMAVGINPNLPGWWTFNSCRLSSIAAVSPVRWASRCMAPIPPAARPRSRSLPW